MAGYSFLSNVLPTAISAVNAVGAVRKQQQQAAAVRQNVANAQAQYNAQQAELAQSLSLKDQENRINADKETNARRDALRRAMARQRAQFGAQGIDSSDGSADAILLGLAQQSDTEQQQQNALDKLRTRALRDDAATQSRKNLLALNNVYDRARLSSLFSD